ncbi:hypothetical protein SCLCIDRAFT_1140750 [Scleroderma citrinum Foug A]|uniref:Uncharacterized protein n=1 Tax=Scleroderma citrinum Foug A TaxID=1036808 RepID=A0A0C3DMT5_9AGAM|nr:hypothetical protein SCLCIDRAFT_1140750 [Scleroderma citrinum Foug A]
MGSGRSIRYSCRCPSHRRSSQYRNPDHPIDVTSTSHSPGLMHSNFKNRRLAYQGKSQWSSPIDGALSQTR